MNKITRLVAPLILIPVAFAASTRQDQQFVTKLYQDLLHRTPSSAELNMLMMVLNAKGGGELVPAVITASTEFRMDEVRGYYNQFLGRQPADGEISALIGLLFNGSPNDDVKAVILASDEYFRHSGGSNPTFLARLYMDVLGRPIDTSADLTLEQALRNGASRSAVVMLVLKSEEAHMAVVRGYFERLLRRDPHPSEIADFLPILRMGGQDRILIGLLCNTDEYFRR